MIFLDFDDVIFYSKKFIKDYKNIFSRYGVSEEIFKKHYYQYFKNKTGEKVRRYNLTSHLAGIKKELGINTEKLEKEIIKFIEDTSKYIFKDVIFFLKEFKRSDLILISFSKTEFQKIKINNSKVVNFFKKIIITNGSKSTEVLKIIKDNKTKKEHFFIDDRVDYVSEVKKKVPTINTILVRRKEGRYKEPTNRYCDYEVKNLKEALKIINKNK